MYNCTFSANTGIVGAGIYNYAGTLTVNNCTFSGNIAVIGGGIFNTIGGTVRMNNCTLSGNAANGDGGGIYNDKYNSSVTLLNTIIAGNTSPSGPDVYGAVTSQGHNLVGNSTGSSGWVGSDLLNVNPLLGPLQDNGGPTFTMAPSLSPISAAIDAGDDAVTGAPLNLTSDQRGRPRKSGAHVDIGAVEISPITLVVSNNNDSGSGSLRQTILDAFPYEGDTITFAPNISGTITLSSGELLLNKNLNIYGPGATNLAISGNSASRVFDITNVTVNISGVAIRDGRVSGGSVGGAQPGRENQGGGIFNYGNLGLTACYILNNSTIGGTGGSSSTGGLGEGGGIANYNTLSVSSCYVHNNSASGGHGGNGGTHASGMGGPGLGGGIYNASNLTVTASTISSNTASFGTYGTGTGGEGINGTGFGGGLCSIAGSVSVNISTIANNTANGYGGGAYYNPATFVAVSCTISGNAANLDGNGNGSVGGGIDGVTSVGNLADTIVAANTAGTSPDVVGSFTTGGYNLIGIRDGSSGFANGSSHDLVGTQVSPLAPALGTLADNGGTTPTMALLAGSPAIDQGNSTGLTTDQRGRLRPYDYAGIANAAGGDGSDIGAFELSLPFLNIARSANNVVLSWSASDTGYTLQAKTNLNPSFSWATVSPAPGIVNGQFAVTNPVAGRQKFYRLIQ